MFKSSIKATFAVAGISAFVGLLLLAQDVVIAYHFATGGAADAYMLAISFPLLAINVFGGGTLLAVLVPLLSHCYAAGVCDAEVAMLLKRVRRALGFALLVLCGAWALLYPHVAASIATGFSETTLILSAELMWILVPVLFFAGLVGVDAAFLNSRGHFIYTAALPVFMPVSVIVCVFLLGDQLGIHAAAIGLVAGGMLQYFAARHLAAPLLNLPGRPASLSATVFPKAMRDYGMAVVSAAFLAGIILTDTFMASALPSGSTSTYGYATRPVILVLAFVTIAIGNVILPFFSQMVANQDWSALKRHALFWFGLLGLGSLPVVVIWHAHATEIVALLYQRGMFDGSSTSSVAAVQQVYLLQIPFYLVAVIGWRVMNSLGRHMILLGITAMCFLANLLADIWLAPHLGLQGIAWGTNLAFMLWATLITFYLLRLHGSSP